MSKSTNYVAPQVRLDRALEHFGGRKELAQFLGITVEAVMNWQRENRELLPELQAYRVSVAQAELVERQETAA